jgi:hypothetical protein
MVSGSFDRTHPAEERSMPDGTVYRLWWVRGTFHNDYDLHLFPFDQQTLKLSMFNARAAFDKIVYVLDRRSSSLATQIAPLTKTVLLSPIAAPVAFSQLTQWEPLRTRELRDSLVTSSDLGDPGRIGVESQRELSGFQLTVKVSRRVLPTLTKSLLPLILMTIIMFAALFFPRGLIKEKVTVAITGALSGAVLLSAIKLPRPSRSKSGLRTRSIPTR